MKILMDKYKKLSRVGKRVPIYKYETGVDNIDIYVPETCETIEMSKLMCKLHCTIVPEDTSIDNIKMYRCCTYEESDLEGYLKISTPITTALTKYTGDVNLCLMFIKIEDTEIDVNQDETIENGNTEENTGDNTGNSDDTTGEDNTEEEEIAIETELAIKTNNIKFSIVNDNSISTKIEDNLNDIWEYIV